MDYKVQFRYFCFTFLFFLYSVAFATVDTRLVFISNTFNDPAPGQGTLVLDVEAMSNSGTPFIRVFQDAFRLDATFQAQNPTVTFSDELFPDEEIFPGSGPQYNTTEEYQADGDVVYVYTYNVGTPQSIGTSWGSVVRISVEYTMTNDSTSINWSSDIPEYVVTDFSNNDITGSELSIPPQLTDVPLTDVSLPVEVSILPDFLKTFDLYQNYPNPFNPDTRIEFGVPDNVNQAHIIIDIYNTLGETVRTLIDENYQPGYHYVVWDGRNDQGQSLGSGIYFYHLKSADWHEVKKMILMK